MSEREPKRGDSLRANTPVSVEPNTYESPLEDVGAVDASLSAGLRQAKLAMQASASASASAFASAAPGHLTSGSMDRVAHNLASETRSLHASRSLSPMRRVEPLNHAVNSSLSTAQGTLRTNSQQRAHPSTGSSVQYVRSASTCSLHYAVRDSSTLEASDTPSKSYNTTTSSSHDEGASLNRGKGSPEQMQVRCDKRQGFVRALSGGSQHLATQQRAEWSHVTRTSPDTDMRQMSSHLGTTAVAKIAVKRKEMREDSHFPMGTASTLFRNMQSRSCNDWLASLELQSMLAVGSMATVYRATALGQQIVCKVIDHGGSILQRLQDRRQRADLEGHVAHLLNHLNIVTTYASYSGLVSVCKLTLPNHPARRAGSDATRDVTLHFQEYCSGGCLRDAIDQGTLLNITTPTEQAGQSLQYFKTVAQLGSQLSHGLAYAHACGVVHCDLKAANILLQPLDSAMRSDGDLPMRAKIADWGISNVLPITSGQHTVKGAMLGTVTHMPPELLRPPHVVTTKTDIWSMGMLLWEMWTGELPFHGLNVHRILERIKAGDLPKWPPRTPRLLEALVARCWHMDPDLRPTAQQLAATLSEAADVLKQTEASAEGSKGSGAQVPDETLGELELEHALEDALLNDDLAAVTRHLHSEPAGADHAAAKASEEFKRVQEPPADGNNIARMLWELLHVQRASECMSVEVAPGRTMVVSPLPFLKTERYLPVEHNRAVQEASE